MKKTLLAALLVFIILPMTGCGGSNNPPPPPTPVVTSILSDPVLDGDIFEDNFLPPAYIVTTGVSPVLAGIDPAGEYRAFLNFNLASIPLNAIISSASLDLFVTSDFAGEIPVSIDLVSLQSPFSALTPGDFNSQFLYTIPTILNIRQAGLQQQVSIDVKDLMVKAGNLDYFQVRILCGAGIIEIDETTDFAPLLQVAYF